MVNTKAAAACDLIIHDDCTEHFRSCECEISTRVPPTNASTWLADIHGTSVVHMDWPALWHQVYLFVTYSTRHP